MFLLIRNISVSIGLFLIAGIACLNADSPQQAPIQGIVLDRFKVSREYDGLLVPVKVGGKNHLFLLDTGATISVYDTSFRSLLGESLNLKGASVKLHTPTGEKKGISLFRPPLAKLGNMDLPTDRPVMCFDFERLRKVSKKEIYGAIGMDYLKECVFRVDFDKGEVAFLRAVEPDPGTRIPVSFYYNAPLVEVRFPTLQMREQFLVDTGSLGNRSGNLCEALFDALIKQDVLISAGLSRSETMIGSKSDKKGFVKEIFLGDYSQKNLLFDRSKLNSLGLNYLSRYVVTFDFPNKAIYLKKGRQPFQGGGANAF